jgi:enamine deaminase RidA (YjgF/YER057c/UK114 family)
MQCRNQVAGGEVCKGGAETVEKRAADGLRVVTLRRPAHQELFITAATAAGESFLNLLSKIAAFLRERDARVVSMEIFGVSAAEGSPALRGALGDACFPVIWLDEGHDAAAPRVGVELWAVTGLAVTPLLSGGRVLGSLFDDGCTRVLRLGGLGAAAPQLSEAEQARLVFGQMLDLLGQAGMTFGNVVRTWFFNYKLLDWYDEFNKVRTDFFKEHRVFDGLVPASTGVGGHNVSGSALASGLLALAPSCGGIKSFAVPSPLQCPALKYGSAFSRAVEIAMPDHRRLLISGTASIAPDGPTAHVGDVEAQIKLTMEVAHAILTSRQMDWVDVSRAIGYFKHIEDAPAYPAVCARMGIPALPILLVKEDVCRDDLLFEIELDALKSC